METLRTPTPLELRREFVEMVYRDLHGPAGGPNERVEERNVRGRYIIGLLAPSNHSPIPEPVDELGELAVDGAQDDQDGKTDSPIPNPDLAATWLPSSMGLTFSVASDVNTIQITARWGRYVFTRDEESPEPKSYWQRIPVEGAKVFQLKNGELPPWNPDSENEEVYVQGLVRKRDNGWSVTIFLINGQTEPKTHKDQAWVFQPELSIESPDSAPIFIKRQMPDNLNSHDSEDRAINMLYRHEVEFATGHGIAVHAELAEGYWDRAVRLMTQVMPSYEVERMEPPTIEGLVVDMKTLSELSMGEFGPALKPLVDGYTNWIEEQQTLLDQSSPDLASYVADGTANVALDDCRTALERIQIGIDILDTNPQAAEAFRFANQAMWFQRVRSDYARNIRQGHKIDLEEIDIPKNRQWRPFQLAFVLLNLRGMVDPAHPERSDPTQAFADLLWFPTGGGKTEAYLGLAAFTMGIRRLQGELGGISGQAGVAVLMRYTLRLLTLQQFQRATTLIAACEVIRREDPDKWGPEPFRIGLWVGQRSTPNWTEQSAEAIKEGRGNTWLGGSGTGTPVQLTNCPWCGQPIRAGQDIHVETYQSGRGRTFQFCSDKLGRCPFSRKQSPDEGFPIVVVDEEIYRRLPTLLIATVDKFAQMPWKGETQMLFGRVNGYCPRHGYRSPEINDTDSHPKRGRLAACKTVPIGPFRPPDLIIQDELHLISGPLGTLVGLYETAVDGLSTWELDGQLVRPKVVASTATIRRASSQVHNLFLRQVKIFPPSGLDVTDNYFAQRETTSDKAPGRLYLGVCATGTRLKTVLIRTYVATMAAAQKLFDQYENIADPYMTLVGYFNSMRELGGMRRVVDDAVSTRLRRMEDRGLKNRRLYPTGIEELTSRKGATEIPTILDRLESEFNKERSNQPLDVVLATNMISVGVDVRRLGLMVVASQPKTTAEYIQATSRVGRTYPGVVFTVYNWARPRDISHYERFEHYHATFYQHVEALSVTPFAPRALDRGLTAVLVSYLRLLGEQYNANERANELKRPDDFISRALREISARAEHVSGSHATGTTVQQTLNNRIDEWLSEANKTMTVLGYKGKMDGRTVRLLRQPTEEDWDTFTCLNSLRDVEPSVALVLKDHGMDSLPQVPGNEGHEHEQT